MIPAEPQSPAAEFDLRHLQLARHIRALQKANRRLRPDLREAKRRARTDERTGILRPRAIEGIAKATARRRGPATEALTLGLIDLDNFKAINDRYLWPGGNQALAGVARAMRAALRPTDRLGRYGGDELLLVARLTDEAMAEALAERIQVEVRAAVIVYNGQPINVTLSIGFAVAVAGEAVTLFATVIGWFAR
jgi:diguanylate cyclase